MHRWQDVAAGLSCGLFTRIPRNSPKENTMIAMLNRALLALALTVGLGACDDGTEKVAVTKKAEGVEITITGIETGRDIGSMGLVPSAPAGAAYVHVSYTLKNASKEALSFDKWPQPRLVDPAGHQLEPDIFASTALSAADNPSWAENLNPNISTEGQLVWKVDEKSFDPATWKLRFMSKPVAEFDLK